MREIRTSGSEGGGAGNSTGPPYPYPTVVPGGTAIWVWRLRGSLPLVDFPRPEILPFRHPDDRLLT